MIIDAQVHIAQPGRGEWRSVAPQGHRSAGPPSGERGVHRLPDADQLLREMDAAGVDRAVLVPPQALDGSDRNAASFQAAREHPDRFRVMARLDPAETAGLPLLDAWREVPEFAGVRVSIRPERGNTGLLTDDGAGWLWDALESREIPLMLHAPDLADQVARLARAHPRLRIVYDHLGLSGTTRVDDPGDLIRRAFVLADLSNVAVKASALPTVVTERFPYPILARRIEEVVSAFGAGRVFWGSDLSRSPVPYDRHVSLFRDRLPALDATERDQILGLGIARWIGWA